MLAGIQRALLIDGALEAGHLPLHVAQLPLALIERRVHASQLGVQLRQRAITVHALDLGVAIDQFANLPLQGLAFRHQTENVLRPHPQAIHRLEQRRALRAEVPMHDNLGASLRHRIEETFPCRV